MAHGARRRRRRGAHVDAVAALAESRSDTHRFVPYPETIDALAGFRELGLRTVICSNWSWDLDSAVSSCGLEGAVDASVCSAEVGYRKPHPVMMRAAAHAIGLSPDRLLVVGDTYPADVEGAKASGMDVVLLARDGAEPPGDEAPTAADLLEVLELVATASARPSTT